MTSSQTVGLVNIRHSLLNGVCVCAVSYTHLDVYKRQVLCCFRPVFPFKHVFKFFVIREIVSRGHPPIVVYITKVLVQVPSDNGLSLIHI